jgi:DNA-binding NtrC family response regulator
LNKKPDFSLLLVDDEPGWLRSLQLMLLRTAGINNVLACEDGREVMPLLAANDVGLVVLDLTMPHIHGEDLLASILAGFPDVLVIIVTGLDNVDGAVRCMKAGAYDYLVKVWGEERLSTGILHALRMIELERSSRMLSRKMLNREPAHAGAFAPIITASQEMQKIFRYIEAIASSRQPVLITGESGVGKELIARAVHRVSGCEGPFVSVNMASLHGSMLEDTLFGHTRGAFTSAQAVRNGLAEQAQRGTLFLDEIGELDSGSQAKLLRFLQEGEYYPLGSDKQKRIEARVVLATNQDIVARQRAGTFRADLYYRLQTHHIHIPPLRERKEDIPLLVRHFLTQAARDHGREPPRISGELILSLSQYSFPGNVRELMAMVTRAVSLGGDSLRMEDFRSLPAFSPEQNRTLSDESALLRVFLEMDPLPSLAQVKKIMTAAALNRSGGNQTAAARMLGISQPALSKRVRA